MNAKGTKDKSIRVVESRLRLNATPPFSLPTIEEIFVVVVKIVTSLINKLLFFLQKNSQKNFYPPYTTYILFHILIYLSIDSFNEKIDSFIHGKIRK